MKYSELGNLIKIQKGKKLEEVPNIKKSAIRYIQIGDLRTDENLKYTLNEGNAVLCNSQDILIAWDGANAGTVSFGLEGAIGSTLAKLTLSKEYYPPFVGRFLQSKFEYLQSTCTGATIPHISKAALLKILIPKISIAEQKGIADLMDKADALRKKNQELLAAYDELLKATFLELFGDPVTNQKGWELTTIEKVTKKGKWSIKRGPFGGALKKDIFVEKGYLVYEQYHALNNDFNFERYYIDEVKFQELKAFEVKAGDIIISCSGVYLGKLAIVPLGSKKGIINQALLKLSLDEMKMRNVFFVYHFSYESFKAKYFASNRGAGIPNFPPITDFKKFPFIFPPIELQNKFAQIVENIEVQKTLVKQSLQESEDLFNALVQKAFNGELA